MRILQLLIITFLYASTMKSQTPTDAQFMDKKLSCLAVTYGEESWSRYWESTLYRENGNIGTLTRTTIMPMVAYGITRDINVIAGLPYVKTKTSQGTLAGSEGFQDFSLALKAKIATLDFDSSLFINLIGVLGGAIPVSNYNDDYGPQMLGLGCKEANGRLMVELIHKSGIYLRPQASYHLRTSCQIERDFYYSSEGPVYSDKIDIPNQTLMSLIFGVKLLDNDRLRAEVGYNKFNTIGGTEIRRQEMPLTNSNMDGESMNATMQYHPSFLRQSSIILSYSQIMTGQNIGKSRAIMGGLTYFF